MIHIGVAYYYSANLVEAVTYLERARARLGGEDEYLNLYLGMALRDKGEFARALSVFEDILAKTPDHAWAADWAAECSFKTGDRLKGRRYAKQAMKGGQDTTYARWRGGHI